VCVYIYIYIYIPELRRLEAARDITAILSASKNIVFVPSGEGGGAGMLLKMKD